MARKFLDREKPDLLEGGELEPIELFWMGVGKSMDKHRLDGGEDRGDGADSNSEDEHRHGREIGGPKETAQREAKVGDHRVT